MSGENAVDRRKLLRRAGTVAAGIGAAGVATAVAASPASATDGQPIVQGTDNTGTLTTSISSNASSTLTLANTKMANTLAAGVPLTLAPQGFPPAGAPDGALVVDEGGYLNYAFGGGLQARVYDSSYIPFTNVFTPIRIVDTATADGRFACSAYALDGSSGRIKPRGLATGIDMVVDLSWALDKNSDLMGCAIQFNLTVQSVVPSYTAVWDSGNWPGTSSLNSPANSQAISNFVQTALDLDNATINIKVLKPSRIIIDLCGILACEGNYMAPEGVSAKAPALAKSLNARKTKLARR
ncbi:hypothetical protein HDA40_005142 [Hamadaea flava]|uniref:Uncharacterized protein n=1 Tax=Hamadaea flava TaxID=1742688 RepID=A0ABV8LI36_9ACTN|nr:hypothetical protein [Hamadaea flava]MCP2326635.1 hypothetical protein [Hamadaea flava]